MATFATGQTADVTQWTVFQAGDPEAVSMDDGGRRFTVHRRGVHVVIAQVSRSCDADPTYRPAA